MNAQAVVAAMQRLETMGLNRAASGNASCRSSKPDEFLITPSGVATEQLNDSLIVTMNLGGDVIRTAQGYSPSSEWRFHRDIYAKRGEAGAIVHTHAPFATTLACLHKEIPPFHYMIAVAGGSTIRCAPYALFGTQELSDHALHALENRKACLLANHGMIALGRDLADALRVAVEVESLCEQYWRALQIGEPKLLSDKEMSLVFDKFKNYGPQAPGQS